MNKHVRALLMAGITASTAGLANRHAVAQVSAAAIEQDGILAALTVDGPHAIVRWRFSKSLPAPIDMTAMLNGRKLPISSPPPGFQQYPAPGQSTAVIVLLDLSGPTRSSQIDRLKLAVLRLVQAKAAHDRVAIAVYGLETRLLIPRSTDPIEAITMLLSLAPRNEEANLSGALIRSIRTLETVQADRRGIFVFSDGHNDSDISLEKVLDLAKGVGVTVNILLVPSERPAVKPALGKLATETGGQLVQDQEIIPFLRDPFTFLDSGAERTYQLDAGRQFFWEADANVRVVIQYDNRHLELSAAAAVPKAGFGETASYLVVSHPVWIFGSAGTIAIVGVGLVLLPKRRRSPIVSAAPDPKPLPILAVLEDIGSGTVYPIQAPLVQIGRDKTNDIVLDDGTISRVHAVLQQGGFGEFSIENRSGLNGTMVNHQQVEKSPLSDGDLITMGGKTFSFGRVLGPGA